MYRSDYPHDIGYMKGCRARVNPCLGIRAAVAYETLSGSSSFEGGHETEGTFKVRKRLKLRLHC